MKKVFSLILCLLLVGCTSNVSQEEYDKIKSEVNNLTTNYEQMTKAYNDLKEQVKEIADIKISGGFVAQVIGMCYDPESENGEIRYLTVKRFQGDYEIIRVKDKIANKITTGKTYFFEIEDAVVEKDIYSMTLDQVNAALADNIYAHQWINVTGARTPLDSEMGIAETLIIEVIK